MKSLFSPAFFRLLVFALLASGGLLTTACTKNQEVPDYAAADAVTLQKYVADNAITNAQKQASGLYFIPVTTNATAPLATAGKVVSILYTAKLLDGTVFDATSQRDNTPLSFTYGTDRVLAGIEEGLSLMHLGDKAILLIPSGLAYGTNSSTNVPANSIIRFEIELTDINPSYAVPDDNLLTRYLTKNNITTAQKQASGLYFIPTTVNTTGTPVTAGKRVYVLYTGKFLNGKVFDSSAQHNNTPYDFTVGATPRGAIAGFDEGVTLMRKGEKATLLIPSALAYGARGSDNVIPPNTALIFDIEVVDVK
jgi:peptidylprolyl isomerase